MIFFSYQRSSLLGRSLRVEFRQDSSGNCVSCGKKLGIVESGVSQLGDVVPLVVPSGDILDPSAIEMLAIWSQLDDCGRADLMAVARGLLGGVEPNLKS